MRSVTFNDLKKKMRSIVSIGGFSILLILSIISAILFVVAPITLNEVIENVGKIDAYDILKVIGLLVAGYLVEFLSVFTKNQLIQKYMGSSSRVLYRNVFRLKYDEYINIGPTALQDLVYNTSDAFAGFYFDVVPGLIVNILTIVVTIAIAWSLNHIAAILMFITLPIHYFGFKILNNKLSKLSVKLRQSSSITRRNIHSVISQIDFIKQNSDNEPLLPRLEENILKSEGVRKKVNYVANGASGLLVGLNQIIQTLTVIFLSALALKNKDLFGGVIYVIIVFPYFSNAIRGLTLFNLGIADLKAGEDFLKTLVDNQVQDGTISMPTEIKSITFDVPSVDVAGKNLLNDVKATFKPGDVVGIMGESGTGKSTFVKLIPKFRDISDIYINDIPAKDIKTEEYLKYVSYYSQNTPIISDTILSNLNFGRTPIKEDFYKGLQFLNKFKNLNEVIVENGANLSGGDKQRIALSRYFTEDAKIVILDEPTSSLDKETETNILTELLKDTKDKIIFIISHNEDVMKYCTHLVKLENKKLDIKKIN